jgi:hypothetical protein
MSIHSTSRYKNTLYTYDMGVGRYLGPLAESTMNPQCHSGQTLQQFSNISPKP